MDKTDLDVRRILLGEAHDAYVASRWPDRDDWPTHQPAAPDAPIPGRHWYGGCNPDYPRVRPDGVCEDCGEQACPECGAEPYPDGGCRCTPKQP